VWEVGTAPLSEVANVEKFMPKEYISADGFGITEACREYLLPLIQGEAYPPYEGGLPQYVTLKNTTVEKKLPAFAL
jgi:6-phosphofructokinase 1